MYTEMRATTRRIFTPELGGWIGYVTDWFIMGLIAANVVAVMLETVDPLASQYEALFRVFEQFTVVVFTIEYMGRIWSAVDHPEYDGIISGRLKFASRPLLIIDLLAILPFYLAFAGVTAELRFLRAFRLLRSLRLLKLARYSESLQVLSIVFKRKKEDLAVAAFANVVLLVIASSLMYFVEHQSQPETFASIPQTLWWGVITLTTVGYGDTIPVTPLGQFLGAVTAVLGMGLFALPASILASGFLEIARGETKQCPHCGEEIAQDRSLFG